MKKKTFFIFFLIFFIFNSITYATDEIINSEMESLKITSFIKEGQAYTKESFPNLDIKSLLDSSINGQIDNGSLFKQFISLFGKELKNSFSLIGNVLLIVVIHSVLKSFGSNSKEGIVQIAYYAQYTLIVTIIMTNFSEIINQIRETISNLVGFTSILIPILLALISISRKYCNNFCN